MSRYITIRPSVSHEDDGFEYIVDFGAAWDKRDPDPQKDYGVHGVELKMVLKGPRGAVQFLLYTSWMLDMLVDGTSTHVVPNPTMAPMPADLGYHSPKPMYDGQEPMQGDCAYLGGVPCYYDGSGLNATRIWNALLMRGSDGVWAELRDYYEETFNDNEDDDT